MFFDSCRRTVELWRATSLVVDSSYPNSFFCRTVWSGRIQEMKRLAKIFLAAALMAFFLATASSTQAAEDGCAREDLAKIADKYFVSIREHKTSELPLASAVKFTENGVTTEVGKGF